MFMLNIVTIPNPVLRKRARNIDKIDQDIKDLINDMVETLQKNPRGGIGLAAPQVAESVRVIVVKDGREKNSKTYSLINPTITSSSKELEQAYEGCLSIPNTYCLVERNVKVVVKALNASGKKVTVKASDLFARVLQHEVDHLEGVLIIDKAIGKNLTEEEFDKLTDAE